MSSESAIRPGTIVGARFEIERLAGVGGMGEVYRAVDRETTETVAVKFVRYGAEGYLARFAREAKALSQIAHPGIVRYIAHGTDPATFLAMEWLEGEDLADRLARGALAISEALSLAKRLASALGAAHRRGVVHRDIKPSNVFLSGGRIEEAKIVDFGVAQLAKNTNPLTRTGQLVGTLGYLAPEQALSGRDVTVAADVYSLGCVLFECLTGRRPFQGEGAEVLTKTLLSEPTRVRELRRDAPVALEEMIARMLRKEPATRASLESVAADVASLLASASTEAAFGAGAPPVTGDERRLLGVVLASAPGIEDAAAEAERLGAAHGGSVERLADGLLLLTIGGADAASDLAARAARCALAVRARFPGARVAVAGGRGDPGGLVDEVIARARSLLDGDVAFDGVRIDPTAAALLDVTFMTRGEAPALVLIDESEGRGLLDMQPASTPFVGRDRERSTLQSLVNESLSEPIAMALVVTGQAGVGKSRLVQEVIGAIRRREDAPELWGARGDPTAASTPYAMLAQLLRGAARIAEGDRAEVRRQKLLERVGRNLPISDAMRVAPILGELVGAEFSSDDRPALRAARQDPSLMADEVRDAWESLVEAEVAACPLVILLEDLHWGDSMTVRLVDDVLREQRDRPLLVVAVARPELHEVLPGVFRSRRMNELVLSDLTPSASRRLVSEALGPDAEPARIDAIVARAGGNAFFLEELVRAAAAGDPSMPDTVLAMMQGRLERLQPGARRVLRAASVFGARFWTSAIAALIGADRIGGVRATLEELVSRELVVEAPDARFRGEEELAFRHALVGEAAYEMLTERDRRAAHLAAAEWLEAKGERDALLLAHHLERSGEQERAIVWYLWAAEQALEADDFDEVKSRVDRGIACGAEKTILGELLLLKAEASGWSGDAAHLQLAEGALAHLTEGSAGWSRAAIELALASRAASDAERFRATAERLATARWTALTLPEAWGLARLALALADSGEASLARSVADLTAAAARGAHEEDVPALEAIVAWLRAVVAPDPGALDEAARAVTAALGHAPSRLLALVALHTESAAASARAGAS